MNSAVGLPVPLILVIRPTGAGTSGVAWRRRARAVGGATLIERCDLVWSERGNIESWKGFTTARDVDIRIRCCAIGITARVAKALLLEILREGSA